MFSKLLLSDASSRETSYFLNPGKREPYSGIAGQQNDQAKPVLRALT